MSGSPQTVGSAAGRRASLAAAAMIGVGVMAAVDEIVVRREALLFRMEVRDHHRRVVVAAR